MTSMSSGSHSSFNSDAESSEEEKNGEEKADVRIADNTDDAKNDAEGDSEPAHEGFALRKMKTKRDLSLKERSTLSRVVTAIVGDRVVLSELNDVEMERAQ